MLGPNEVNVFLIAPVECVLFFPHATSSFQCWRWGVWPAYPSILLLSPSCATAQGWSHQEENGEQDGLSGCCVHAKMCALDYKAEAKPFHDFNTRLHFAFPPLHFLLAKAERLLLIFTYPELLRWRGDLQTTS